MQKKPKHYTFMIVPHDASGKHLSFKLPRRFLYAVIGVTVFSVLLLASSLIYSSMLSRRLVHYHQAIAKNREQQKTINTFSHKTRKVNRAIDALVQEDNRIRKLLGLKNWKTKIKLATGVKSKPQTEAEEVAAELKKANLKIADRNKSFQELKSWVNTVRQRFASTPSRWPIYGRIVSRYGYRVYPWRGFHSGIDISGQYGAPVRATASGRVTYIGWRQGYGKTVIVSHGRGVETLYAHCSRYAVKRGQVIKKGQIVSYVGNTGYSTGPHLHYEVRKSNRTVNPVSYLNLNILSASKIWRR